MRVLFMYLFLNLSGGILVEFFFIKFLGKTKGEVINFPAIYSSFFQIYWKRLFTGANFDNDIYICLIMNDLQFV